MSVLNAKSERVRRLAERALQKGLECSRRATHTWLCQAMKGGAGPAHRVCGKEDALPELPLVIRDRQGDFTADRSVFRNCTLKNGNVSGRNEDAIGFSKEIDRRRSLREKHVAEARVWASSLGLRAVDIRKACLSFPSMAITNSAEGAEPSPSCTQHTVSSCGWVSAHISQWDVKFAGKWDSALKGNSALRAHVARAAGIELAHNRGHYVIHFLWDMRKFYDSIKTHLLSPQLVARCYPLEILV